jgi:translation initiation factor 2B subunit (eIF-2B alpha/beta/delta family)
MNADVIRTELRKYYGGVETLLEQQYEERIVTKLLREKAKVKDEWATYNQLILEFKNTLKNILLVKELQYRLTDEENPNQACISVIEKLSQKTPEIERLYQKISNFILHP